MSARVRLRAMLVLLAVGASVVGFARPAAAAGDAGYYVAQINAIRASRGLGTLAFDGQLAAVAQSWSLQMAADATLAHNPNLASQVSGWRTMGENVGTGGDDTSIEAAFEASPHHFENMVDPAFTRIGVAVVQDASGTLWVTEDYEQPKGAASAAPAPRPAASPPAAKPAPRAVPRPAPAPHPVAAPVHAAPVHAAAAPAPAPAPATTVATTPAPAPAVPVAVLGSADARPTASRLGVTNPFTAANLTGLMALVVLGASMALFARAHTARVAKVRVRTAAQAS
jgi:hypothetical protein